MINTGQVFVVRSTRRPYHSPQREARAPRDKPTDSSRCHDSVRRARLRRHYHPVRRRESQGVGADVETLFGTKARLLKATIDVAIAGDDEPVPMLDRDWAMAAIQTTDVETFLSILASVLAPAQGRSSGLVLSVFEGAGSDPELADLADQMSTQRATMATWVVGRLTALGALHSGVSEDEAVDNRLRLHGTGAVRSAHPPARLDARPYEHWVARSLRCLLVIDDGQRRQSSTNPRRSST